MIAIAVIVFGLYVLGSRILDFFGIGNPVREVAVALSVEGRGMVQVSLKGEDLTRVESDLKLYPEDRIVTGASAHASLTFFDGSQIRLDENTDVTVEGSEEGAESSWISLHLTEGTLWIATPTRQSYSGSVLREIDTPVMSFTMPSRLESVLTPRSVIVFSADGLGVAVDVADADETVSIGEGQQFLFPPASSPQGDLYQYRAPLDPLALRTPFVESSRTRYAELHHTDGEDPWGETGSTSGDDDVLTLTYPEDGITVDASTIIVTGQVGADAAFVRINGYEGAIDPETHAFSQEISLPDSDEVRIHVEALSESKTVIGEVQRTIKRNRKAPEPPEITSPAENGQTYRTQKTTLEIRGKPPADAVGIIVNDYRLQLFTPGDANWTYLASTNLANYVYGKNVFSVTAINKGGYVSEPALITVLLEDGPEGIVADAEGSTGQPSGDGGTDGDTPEEETPDQSTLPQNPPLARGSIRVTAPTPGTSHATTEKEVVIEGITSVQTETLWVNDYKLQLFTAGSTTWNYIASTELGNMNRGENTYRITARNDEGMILDTFDYIVNFDARAR